MVDPSEYRPTWGRVGQLIALWILGGGFIGFAAAFMSGAHGSILWLILALLVGISGAIAHSALIRIPGFLGLAYFDQVFRVFLCTALLPELLVFFTAPDTNNLRYGLLYVPVLLLSLLGACVMVRLTKAWGEREN